MTEIQGFEKFKDIVSHVEIGKFGIEGFEFGVLDMINTTLGYTSTCFAALTFTYSDTIDGVFDWITHQPIRPNDSGIMPHGQSSKQYVDPPVHRVPRPINQ